MEDDIRVRPVAMSSLFYTMRQDYQRLLDYWIPHPYVRWGFTALFGLIYILRILLIQVFYIITYALGIVLHHLNLFTAFLTPKIDPGMELDRGVESQQPSVARLILPPLDATPYSEQELTGLFGVTLQSFNRVKISRVGADVLVDSWMSFIQLTRDLDVSKITLGLMGHRSGCWTVKCPACGCKQRRFWSEKTAASYLPARLYSRDLRQMEFYVREDRGACAIVQFVESNLHPGRQFHISKTFLTRN